MREAEVVGMLKPSITYPVFPLPPLIPLTTFAPPLVGGHKGGNFEGREDASEQYQEGTLVAGHKCGRQRWWAP